MFFFHKESKSKKKKIFLEGGWRGGQEGGGLELVNFFTKSPNLRLKKKIWGVGRGGAGLSE